MPDFDWSAALQAAAEAGDERPTRAYDWPAGQRLARILAEVAVVSGKRVCDIGCGKGGLGHKALELGAASVCFADASPHPLAYLAEMLAGQPISCKQHRWGEPVPGAPFDLILGGDILYRPECQAELLQSIAASLAADGLCLLCDPRSRLERQLPELAARCALSWDVQFRDGIGSLVVCRRIPIG